MTVPFRTPGFAAAVLVLVVGACGRAEAPRSTAAATVSNPVTESALTTLTLTSDAVLRLGIQTAAVESASVALTRTVGGEIVAPPGQAALVAAPSAGRVLAPVSGTIPVAGTQVTSGQALLRLVALPPDRDMARVQADLRVAEANLARMRAEAERTARLFADRLVSARDNERAQADFVAAKEARDVAAAQLAVVQGAAGADINALTPLVITAPVPGVVRQVHVAAGQTVAAGTPLAEVVDVSRVWVRVPVYAGDAGRFARTGEARVHGLGSGETVGVPAARIAGPPIADASAASVDLYYEIRTASNLRPGERVSVTAPLTGSDSRGLVVPIAAVVRDANGGSWVYERRDSLTFVRRRVDVAAVRGGLALLARGPAVGTLVVTDGAIELFGTEFGAGH
jgi:RND family efflux transporter MFP subunit